MGGGELIREGGLKGTGWRFSAYSLIKLLFSNLLLILSVNKPTHMIVSGRFQSVFQSRSVFQSNLKQVQKKFVDYANATNAEFIIDPKVLFHGWWIYSHLHISWSSECQGSVQVGSLTTSWYDHIACIEDTSLRSMAVLSSGAQERRSREICARSARERAAKLQEK